MFKKIIPAAMLLISTFATAQEVYWKPQPVTVKVANGDSQASFNGVFQRVVLQHNFYECGYEVDPVVQVVSGTCYDVSCQGGAGKSELWNAFFSAKKEEKPSRLAQAIKGVGKASAESLVAGGYFNSKPKSWDAFKSVINQAAANGAITQQVKTLVLSNYRNENMANLGYNGGCTSTPYTCEEVNIIQAGYYVPKTCDAPVEQVIDTKPVSYQFNVQNAVLLPTEQESLVFNLTALPSEATLNPSVYNKYSFQAQQVSDNQIVVNVQGVARNQVSLPSNAIQSVALIPVSGNSATLQVTVLPSVLPANNQEQLVISYEVKSCKMGFLPCGIVSWDEKKTFTSTITGAVTSINVASTIPNAKKGIKIDASVKIYKQNSIYHNAQPVSKNAEAIKLK